MLRRLYPETVKTVQEKAQCSEENTRKFTIRAALVTGSTLATLAGAQILAVR